MVCLVPASAARLKRVLRLVCAGLALAPLADVAPAFAAIAPDHRQPVLAAVYVLHPLPHAGRTDHDARSAPPAARRIRIAQAAGNQAGTGSFFGDLFKLLGPKPKPTAKPSPEAVVVPGFGAMKKYGKALPGLRTKATKLGGGGASFGGSVESAPAIGKAKREGRYRTLCVRLCDGYYWPISTKAPMSRFNRDKSICESSCGSEAKLFYQAELGGDAAKMIDLAGKPYKKLKTAFLYRKQFVPSCRCRPEPWSQSELLRHSGYSQITTIEEPPDHADVTPVAANPEDLAAAETGEAEDLSDIAPGEDESAGGDEQAALALAEESLGGPGETIVPAKSPLELIKPGFRDPISKPATVAPASIAPEETGTIAPLPEASGARARHAIARER